MTYDGVNTQGTHRKFSKGEVKKLKWGMEWKIAGGISLPQPIGRSGKSHKISSRVRGAFGAFLASKNTSGQVMVE